MWFVMSEVTWQWKVSMAGSILGSLRAPGLSYLAEAGLLAQRRWDVLVKRRARFDLV